MKRLDYTKVSVKLKKSEWRDEWFIYLEAYPVYETGNDKPKRVREYLRIVNWRRLHTLLSMFAKCDYIQFSQIDMMYIEAFRSFLIKAPQGGSKKGTIFKEYGIDVLLYLQGGTQTSFRGWLSEL